jgi:hypothetical protein
MRGLDMYLTYSLPTPRTGARRTQLQFAAGGNASQAIDDCTDGWGVLTRAVQYRSRCARLGRMLEIAHCGRRQSEVRAEKVGVRV